ncbi:TrmB family transcription regulator protein [Halorhabdus tiamatea SARL4B]|uniref:TrmB family transcription regulator protein n=2 Tax=Halorhabdus tiamatea SARL4B TaxID=1033806 RepID=U2DZ03_9EURY|nr:helix-turn-helix domain-containing protein [Halorhabdus tiamatea]ERJ05388.1 TrmB family transcription regulator protein [Halorhabdus tiamatea SARL4B]
MGTDQENAYVPTDTTTSGAGQITELGPVVDMLEKPQMAALYTAARDTISTVPELQDHVELTKSTVYEYVAALQRAGLLSEVETDGSAKSYTAHEFTVTLEVDGMVVEITPDVVEVLSHQHSLPEIEGFLEQYGLGTLAAFIDLAYEHAAGEVTTRMIADILDVSRGSAYDMLEHVGRILDIGDEPTTDHATDLSDDERDALLER